MIRRLYLRIYLTTLAALALVVVLCAVLWQSIVQRPDGRLLMARIHADAMHLHLDGIAMIVVIARWSRWSCIRWCAD